MMNHLHLARERGCDLVMTKATLLGRLPNMPKNITVHQERIEHAMWVLLQNFNLSVPKAMNVVDFLKKDVANKSIHEAIQ